MLCALIARLLFNHTILQLYRTVTKCSQNFDSLNRLFEVLLINMILYVTHSFKPFEPVRRVARCIIISNQKKKNTSSLVFMTSCV